MQRAWIGAAVGAFLLGALLANMAAADQPFMPASPNKLKALIRG